MAEKFILKRSSILGKRPTNLNLEPGEIGLNTNNEDPGAFFEVSDGNIVKIGPTSVSLTSPVKSPEKGEMWFDLGGGTLKVGSVEEARKTWRVISAPFLGGGGTTVFVAPEFSYSTDGLTNDGQALPFQTLTRAIIELSKVYISRVLSGFTTQSESNRYTIVLAPSTTVVNNSPGKSLEDFNVDFSSNAVKEVTYSDLTQFNSTTGGVIVPFGISIVGMDLKKSVIIPSYVPSYKNFFFPEEFQGSNQPITSILKCSGNTYLSNFSVTDKNSFSEIVEIFEKNSFAAFESERPHGFELNDKAQITFSANVDQSTGNFLAGEYYIIPIDTFRFYLSTGIQGNEGSEPYVPFVDMPDFSGAGGPKLKASVTLKSAHRLRALGNVSKSEIGDFFTKVQRAFPFYFGGRVTDGKEIVNSGDYIIVGPAENNYPDNISSNTTKNSSLYANQVNLRSEYGMCWGDFDGSIVGGFKSVVVNASTAVSLQNDPNVYEIYATLINEQNQVERRWWNLTQATFLSTPSEKRPATIADVLVSDQLNLLNNTPINNIRYYYQNLTEPSENKSLGIVDTDIDFRHFGFRVSNGAYGQFQSIYTIGPAIGVWALNGGTCNLTNSTSNFGSIAFRAEGFYGINTLGGANANSKGFVFEGIQRPLALSRSQVENNENKKILSLGSKVKNVYLDPADPYVQIVELNADFVPSHILPYSLKPGSALWIEAEGCTYRGFFVTDGGSTVITGLDDPYSFAKLRIRASDSTIPNDPGLLPFLGIPYIRRFFDPRSDFDKSYSFYITNTTPTAVAPQVGAVLRLNQTSQQQGANSLRPNVQFDPGILGGWGRVFTVDAVETGSLGSSPQFNYVVGDTNQDLNYYVAITASDYSRPWLQNPNFLLPTGSYTTHKNRNWYTAENNLWDYLYYGEDIYFNEEFGPLSLAPYQPFSPFVDTCVLDKQENVQLSFQGSYSPDPYLAEYAVEGTYYRGSTSPYPTYSTSGCYDDDDSSDSLGLCLTDFPISSTQTYTVSPFTIIQTEQLPELKTESSTAKRYRPAIVEFSVLSSISIPNPKQKVSVLQIKNNNYVEYIRVINLNGTLVKGIRLTVQNSSYPSLLPENIGTNFLWPVDSSEYARPTVTVCDTNPIPDGRLYDPHWTSTKSAVLRFFEVMGYPNSVMFPFLEPKFWGERLLPVARLKDITPSDGYAVTTDKWPLEFNQPSAVIANTHTWGYTGYYNYSRGLLEYQTTDITRKLSADFQASTLWSGRLTVTGITDKGEIIQFGPQRQALTANYYDFSTPTSTRSNNQIYEEQSFIEYPSQVIVFSADDISPQFDCSKSSFELRRGGSPIPDSQLSAESMLVVLGGVVQNPGVDYTVEQNTIKFTNSSSLAPELSCNIRVITSADSNKTLITVPFNTQDPDPVQGYVIRAKSPTIDISNIEITANNTFVIVGGVEQIPLSDKNEYSSQWAYTLDRIAPDTIEIIFNEPLPPGITIDIRSVCTSPYWAVRSIYPVSVYSLDSLTPEFDGSKTIFDLKLSGIKINPQSVTRDNLVVSLGGAIQVPGYTYDIVNGQIVFDSFSDAPLPGTVINMRVIANSEFIGCPGLGTNPFNLIEWGPSLIFNPNEGGYISTITHYFNNETDVTTLINSTNSQVVATPINPTSIDPTPSDSCAWNPNGKKYNISFATPFENSSYIIGVYNVSDISAGGNPGEYNSYQITNKTISGFTIQFCNKTSLNPKLFNVGYRRNFSIAASAS
jgi:hypothetical protein